jgi:PmbA protein
LIELARRAVEATLTAGASDAEAYLSEETGREVRVHGGEVESLTAATKRGIGIRAWIGNRVGYAYDTDLSEAGLARLAARAAEVAGLADEDEFAGPPRAGADPVAELELSDPAIGQWPIADVAELALAVEADRRIAGVEQAVYADSAERVAITSSTGISAEYERSDCYAYLQALAEDEGGRETGLGFGLGRGPVALDPAAIGREGAERAVAMIGARKPESRSCPVLLDPTVAASFAGIAGAGLGASAVQRGRSPFAGLLGSEVAGTALVLHDDGLDPDGSASSPVDGEGVPRRRTALIEDGNLRTYLFDTYTAHRGEAASTGSARRGGYRSQPSRRGRGRFRHRRGWTALWRQPRLRRLLGRRVRARDPRWRAGRAPA